MINIILHSNLFHKTYTIYTEQQKKRIIGMVYNWGLNTDLMICKVSLLYLTCVLSNASQMYGSLE